MAHPLHAYLALLDDLRTAGFRCHPISNYFAAQQVGHGPICETEHSHIPCIYLRREADCVSTPAASIAEGEANRGIRNTKLCIDGQATS